MTLQHQSGLFTDTSDRASPAGRVITFEPTLGGWRQEARRLIADGVSPAQVWWQPGPLWEPKQASKEPTPADAPAPTLTVPRTFASLARAVACHRASDRWALLYEALWRLTHGEPHLLELTADACVARLRRYDKAVHRDAHKMKAFVRFRTRPTDDGQERFVAWFEPEHHIVEYTSGFFQRRFTTMRWSILTPEGCAHWDGPGAKAVRFEAGLSVRPDTGEDPLEAAWRTYYRSIFNPARVKTDAMRAEMPQKYWKNLPEATLIPAMLLEAESAPQTMISAEPDTAALRCGPTPSNYLSTLGQRAQSADPWEALYAGIERCGDCAIGGQATQSVMGEGPRDARIMLIGEQPGDQEDLTGRPFVGPAGQVLDQALAVAGINRSTCYLTNAVKHFKHRPVGRRRLHETPREGEVHACRQWLQREMQLLQPEVVVCLGKTAATAVLQRAVSMREETGHCEAVGDRDVWIAPHPASILRSRETGDRLFAALVTTLSEAATTVEAIPSDTTG